MKIRRSFQRALQRLVAATGDAITFDSVGETLQPTMLMLDGTGLEPRPYHTLGGFQAFAGGVAGERSTVYYQAPPEGARFQLVNFVGGFTVRTFEPGTEPALAPVGGSSIEVGFNPVGPPLRGTITLGSTADAAVADGLGTSTFIGNQPEFELDGGRILSISEETLATALTVAVAITEYIPIEVA